jgi:hypothetical protein
MQNWKHWGLYPQWPASCIFQWLVTLFPNNIQKEKAVEENTVMQNYYFKIICKS